MGLGPAVEKFSGSPISYDTSSEIYRTRVPYKRFGLAFAITEDAIDDSEAIDLAMTMSEHLARSMSETREAVHADLLNRATNASYPLGDGQTLFSASHPLGGGGTFSNYLAATQLSDFALKLALIKIATMPDERGKKIAMKAVRLLVPPENEYIAYEIMQSEKVSGTANNNVNSVRAMGRFQEASPTRITRWTASTAWGIQTDAPSGFLSINHPKGAMKKGMEGDFESGNVRYKAHERYAALVDDPRCFVGSLGA
jgi:phage major head subunit gpT-like protein